MVVRANSHRSVRSSSQLVACSAILVGEMVVRTNSHRSGCPCSLFVACSAILVATSSRPFSHPARFLAVSSIALLNVPSDGTRGSMEMIGIGGLS